MKSKINLLLETITAKWWQSHEQSHMSGVKFVRGVDQLCYLRGPLELICDRLLGTGRADNCCCLIDIAVRRGVDRTWNGPVARWDEV